MSFSSGNGAGGRYPLHQITEVTPPDREVVGSAAADLPQHPVDGEEPSVGVIPPPPHGVRRGLPEEIVVAADRQIPALQPRLPEFVAGPPSPGSPMWTWTHPTTCSRGFAPRR